MKRNGWIDLQVNGYGGVNFNAEGLSAEAVRAVTERLESRIGFTPEECRAVGRDNPLALIGADR